MVQFVIGQSVTTKVPQVTVDAGLKPGAHRFRLVVTDEQGLQSRVDEIVVQVREGVIDPRPPVLTDPIVTRPPIPFPSNPTLPVSPVVPVRPISPLPPPPLVTQPVITPVPITQPITQPVIRPPLSTAPVAIAPRPAAPLQTPPLTTRPGVIATRRPRSKKP